MKIFGLLSLFALVSCASAPKPEMASADKYCPTTATEERAPASNPTMLARILNLRKVVKARAAGEAGADLAGAMSKARVGQKKDFTVLGKLINPGDNSKSYLSFFDFSLTHEGAVMRLSVATDINWIAGTSPDMDFARLGRYLGDLSKKNKGTYTKTSDSVLYLGNDGVVSGYERIPNTKTRELLKDKWMNKRLFSINEHEFKLENMSEAAIKKLIDAFSNLEDTFEKARLENYL